MATSKPTMATSTDSINFFRVCRIILDDCPGILRTFFKERVKAKYGYCWSENKASGRWLIQKERWKTKLSQEQIALLEDGNTSAWDPTIIFHVLLHSSLCLLAEEALGIGASFQPGSNVVTFISHPSAHFPRLNKRDKVMFDFGQEMFRSEVTRVDKSSITLKHSPAANLLKSINAGSTVKMFVCQLNWYDVEELSYLRNDMFAHCKSASTSVADLKALVQNVEQIYRKFGLPANVISQMKAIETEEIAEDKVVQRLNDYCKKWEAERHQNIEVIQKITVVEKDVIELRGEVNMVKEDIPKLKEVIEKLDQDHEEATKRAEDFIKQHKGISDRIEQNYQLAAKLDNNVKDIESKTDSSTKEIETLKLKQAESDSKFSNHLEHQNNVIQVLKTSQVNAASRISANMKWTQECIKDTKTELLEADAAVLEQLSTKIKAVREELSLQGKEQIESLQGRVTGVEEDVVQLMQDVDLMRQESKEFDPLWKLNASHFENDILYYSEKHHIGTRCWLFDQIRKWHSGTTTSLGQPKICVISANPGMGKSVIAAKLCTIGQKEGLLAGCFFFQHHKLKRNTPRMLVQTLAYQFCLSIPAYCDYIKEVFLSDMELEKMNSCELFTYLIHEPLCKLPTDAYSNKFIVVDALDECDFESYDELTKLIVREFVKLPKCISVILTTRPEMKILGKIKKIKPVIQLDPSDPRNEMDITLFLSDVLKSRIDSNDFEAALQLLVKKSEGMFLYFHYVIDALTEEQVLTLAKLESLLPDGIDDYYDQNFQRLYKSLGHEKYHKLLQAIVAAKAELPQDFVCPLLQVSFDDSAMIVQNVSILLPVCNGHFHMFHKSVRDWLIDKDLAGNCMVDASDGHKSLALLCYDIINNIKVNKTPLSVLGSSLMKIYAVENIVHHLCHVPIHDAKDKLISTLLDLQFIFYRLSLSKGTAAYLLEDFNDAIQFLTSIVAVRKQLEHYASFVKHYAIQLSSMPHLVLQLALNEFDELLCHEIYMNDPAGFFPGINVLLEVSNRVVNRIKASTTYPCKNTVTCCIQSLDEQFIICSDVNSTIYIWKKSTVELQHTVEVKAIPPITTLSASPDGRGIAFGDITKMLSIEGKLVPLIPSVMFDTNACVFTSDNKKLLTWSHYSDGYLRFLAQLDNQFSLNYTVQLWDLEKSKCMLLESTTKSSRPHCACFTYDNNYILCGHYDGRILQWEVANGMLRAVMHTDGTVIKQQGASMNSNTIYREDQISHVTCSPNGYYFAACCRECIIIWDALSLTVLQKLKLKHATPKNKARFLHCNFSADSTHLVASSDDGFLTVWKNVANFECDIYIRLQDNMSYFASVLLDTEMNVIFGAANAIYLYKYSDLKQHMEEMCLEEKQAVHPGCAWTSCFLPNEDKAITFGGQCLCLWDAPHSALLQSATDVIGSLIRLSPNGNFLLTYGDGVYIQLWDTNSLCCLSTLINSTQNQHESPNSRGPNDSSPDDICHCAVSNNGFVVGGTGNGVLYLWHGEGEKSFKLLKGHESLITYCDFMPDGSRFISADMDGHIILWHPVYIEGTLEVNKVELEPHADTVEMVLFCLGLQARRIISCSSDNNLHLYDGPSGDLIKVMKGHLSSVLKMTISSDGSTIASGDELGQVILWDSFTGEIKTKFPCPEGMIMDLQFFCGGEFLYTRDDNQDSCAGNIIRVYDVLNSSYASCITFPWQICSTAASKCGEQKWMLCGLRDESIKFIKVHNLHNKV